MEQYQMRFGVMAVKMGLVSKNQLVRALSIQVDDEIENRSHKLIGTILFNLGYIRHKQIDKVLDAIERQQK